MKYVWFIAVAASIAMTGCKGGENAERAGANIDDSEVEVTAPIGREMPETETVYNPRPETDYAIDRQDAGGTWATDGM